jgi:toxin ParE1/3/4
MSNYNFSVQASLELEEIEEYMALNDPAAAARFVDAVFQKCILVANFPNIGKSYENLAPSLRGFLVDDYIIFYYPRVDGIDVTRVLIGYRDLEGIFSQDEDTS